MVHRKLVHKLSKLGVGGPVLPWLKSFLTKRSQRVVVDGQHSELFGVESGVAQGSVLGPFLFILYISDLCENIQAAVGKALFADDLKCYASDRVALQSSIDDAHMVQCLATASKSKQAHMPEHRTDTGCLISG